MSTREQTAEPAGNTLQGKSADIIQTAALGRPFQLGMLYDCRNDALIHGVTLWDHDNLQNNKSVQQQHNTEFNVTTSDSIEEKSNSLKISGSLKLSLLGGLVNVGGSAKYFQDTKKSHKQARVTLQYRTTTKYESLTMHHLAHGQMSHPNVFQDDIATHVVTAILYGAGAYFVFDRESSSEDDRKQVEGEANLTFNRLKLLTVDADASLNMDNEEKAAAEKFTCTFHGDFQLTTNPTSFSDAVSVYTKLPNMLGEKREHAVPLRVWLYPLVKLDSKAAKLQRDISNDLVTYSSETIESLTMTEMRCSDILKDTTAETFPAWEEKIQTLRQKCCHYKLDFMQKLGSVLPSIRGGVKEESALGDILKEHEQSPFNSNDLSKWLTYKERESNTLKSFLKQLKKHGARMDDNLDDLLCDLEVNTVVCFSFTSVDQPDSFLVKLSDYLKPLGMVAPPGESSYLQARNTTWLSPDAIQTMRRQLQLFGELKELNNCDHIKFMATSKYDESHPGAWIFIYEDGCCDAFVPPSKPATPTINGVTHDRFTVMVSEPGSATVDYRVEYRMKQVQETEWASHPLKNQEAVTLSGLKPETEYDIRATAVGKLSYEVSSDGCSVITLTAVGPPTEVNVTEKKANSITLTWSIPSVQRCKSIKGYIIEFREENSNQWQSRDTRKEVYTFTLDNLKQNMAYSIRMCTDVGVGVSQPGEEFKIKTKKAQLDENKFSLLQGDNLPRQYLLDLTPPEPGQLNKMVFGSPSTKNPSNKTIMVVGATGSGKTTLINGMINYVLGVEWEDNWRYKLIDEQTNKTQAHSQTSEVTAYQIYPTDGFKVPFSLTIIDTPGFGDTRGIKQDKEITEKIRKFFSVKDGIDQIDAVCFVVQSALARLTHTQTYIFDSILSIFGKDIASNIIVLVTFADGQSPPVLEAIKAANIPCALHPDGSHLHFKFNNSVLFAKNTGASRDEDNFDYMFWKMGKASMNTFFTQLNLMKPQSLTLTKEVLNERRQLEATVEGVQPKIRLGLSKLEEIKTTKHALQNCETHMKENKDFDYVVIVDKSDMINIPPGTYITNCHGCNYTCHYPCAIPNDGDKNGCAAITDGYCRLCPKKCHWSKHFNMRYRWEIKREPEKRTYQDLKKKYEEALGGKMNKEKIITHLELEYEQMQREVVEMMTTLTKSLQRLSEIALRPDPLSTPDYIDILIETEKQEAKPGYQKRIKELQEVRERALILKKLGEGGHLTGKEKSTLDMMRSKVKGLFNNWFASSNA